MGFSSEFGSIEFYANVDCISNVYCKVLRLIHEHHLGSVVQNFVSLTSSLRPPLVKKMPTTLRASQTLKQSNVFHHPVKAKICTCNIAI